MTFSRVARLLALVLVAAALWRARPADAPSRVAVLVLPGTPAETLAGLAAEDGGAIDTSGTSSGSAFWRLLLTLEDDTGRDPQTLVPLWQSAGGAVRSFGIPSRLFGNGDASAASAFAGSSGGAVVEYDDLTAGRLPSPYDRAIEAVTSVAATLGRDQWSDWIRVTPAPATAGAPTPEPADFQFARVGDSAYLFSPAYVVAGGDATPDPFLRGADREQRPLLASHVLDRARRREAGLAKLFEDSAESGPVVVFHDAGEDVASVFAPDTVPASVREEVARSVASTLGLLRSAVGGGGVVFVVGGPTTARPSAEAWYRIVAGGDSAPAGTGGAPAKVDLASARALLRHLVGVTLDAAEKPLVPPALAMRFPVKPSIARQAVSPKAGASTIPWSAANLESLPGAVASAD